MGDGIKSMYEDYEEYTQLCSELDVPAYSLRNTSVYWGDHWKELKESQKSQSEQTLERWSKSWG